MRMRKKKNLDTRLEACSDVMITDPAACKGQWRALFGNENPLHVEIGCGKGRFIVETARRNPDINLCRNRARKRCAHHGNRKGNAARTAQPEVHQL